MIWNRATTSNGVYNSYYISQLQIIAVKDIVVSWFLFKFLLGFITLCGVGMVLCYMLQQTLDQQNLLFFFTAQAYPQKNSSYLSVKERKGDQTDIYVPL